MEKKLFSTRFVASEIGPESRHCLLRDLRILEAIPMVVEHGELVSAHDIVRRLSLNATPDIPNGLLQYCRDGGMDLTLFVVPDYSKCFRYRELAVVTSFC